MSQVPTIPCKNPNSHFKQGGDEKRILPNGIIIWIQGLETNFTSNVMKQGSWQNEISGIIVKPFACTTLMRDQGDRKPALQVTPITASQVFILSLFHHRTIIKKVIPLHACCWRPQMNWRGWIWMKEQLTCGSQQKITSKLSAPRVPLHRKPVKNFGSTQAFTQLRANIFNEPAQVFQASVKPEPLLLVLTYRE